MRVEPEKRHGNETKCKIGGGGQHESRRDASVNTYSYMPCAKVFFSRVCCQNKTQRNAIFRICTPAERPAPSKRAPVAAHPPGDQLHRVRGEGDVTCRWRWGRNGTDDDVLFGNDLNGNTHTHEFRGCFLGLIGTQTPLRHLQHAQWWLVRDSQRPVPVY